MTLQDITIRATRPDDKARLAAAFQALDGRSIYLRFFSHKKRLTDEELRRVTECDGRSEAALVATVGRGDRETIIGMANYARTGQAAEIAFVVAKDFQGRGLANRLLRELADVARANGISQLEGDVLPENTPMLNVLRRSGLRMHESVREGAIHVTLFWPPREALNKGARPPRAPPTSGGTSTS